MNRRAFVQRLGSAAGVEAPAPIRIANNENPYGPAPAALAAIREIAARANRYPPCLVETLVSAIALKHDVPAEHILLSGGSGDVMRAAVHAFTSRTRALVTARPSYEAPMRVAQHIGSPVIRVPLTPALRVDVASMGARAMNAGLMYVCNPNNPTATVVPADDMTTMIDRVTKASPDTAILVDEAYVDYAEDPGAASMIPLVAKHPQVIVTRTFSKIYGMAGMRVGYAVAQPGTLEQVEAWHSRTSLSALSVAAATAALADTAHAARVADLNRKVRAFMVDTFTRAGYRVAPADANFIFVNVRRDARQFQEACRLKGVYVGRAFPPLRTWARISVGTREEMDVAVEAIMHVLAVGG